MLGMGRTVRGGKTTEYEYLQIRDDSGRLVYDARPSGQAQAIFPLLTLNGNEVVFENSAHDFPQRVIYRRGADGSVSARIEGTRNGKVSGIDFPYRRCP
jgi:flagellar basal body rod protein FlgF